MYNLLYNFEKKSLFNKWKRMAYSANALAKPKLCTISYTTNVPPRFMGWVVPNLWYHWEVGKAEGTRPRGRLGHWEHAPKVGIGLQLPPSPFFTSYPQWGKQLLLPYAPTLLLAQGNEANWAWTEFLKLWTKILSFLFLKLILLH